MKNKQRVTGIIRVYSKRARDQMVQAAMNFFKNAGISEYADDIFACVDELIKNAVKANYKYLLILEKIQENLMKSDSNNEEVSTVIKKLLDDKRLFDNIANEINKNEDLQAYVREILNEEARHLKIKNRAYENNLQYSEEDKKIISGLTKLKNIREKMKSKDIKILLRVEGDSDFIYIEVTNTAPILSEDMRRIHEKRTEYRQYKNNGREYEFFINNIDTSESGFGLGYAKIDSFLSNLGLNAESSVTIISANNTTAMLSIPVCMLKRKQSA